MTEPVAWMWQHEDTGMVGFVQHAPDEELRHWERANRPRKIVTPLYASPAAATALQQERIKALEEALLKMLDAFYEDPFEADTGAAVHKAYEALLEQK